MSRSMIEDGTSRSVFPLLPLRGMIVFPGMVTPLEVGRERSIAALEEAMLHESKILLAAQRDARIAEPQINDIYQHGVIAQVKQLLHMPEGQIKVLVEGVTRCHIDAFEQESPFYRVQASIIEVPAAGGPTAQAHVQAAKRYFGEYEKHKRRGGQWTEQLGDVTDPSYLADYIATHIEVDLEQKQRLLEIADPIKRLEALNLLLAKEIELQELDRRIQSRVRKQMERSQREYYLREQMKAIQRELGERDPKTEEVDELRRRIEETELPEEVAEKALHELGRLEKMPPAAAEAVVVRNYLDWLLALPWSEVDEETPSIDRAESVLNEDHYGLERVKERICEFLAVRQLSRRLKAPVLCLVGPPGVGKTSLGRSVARALGRKFVRFSLGGVRDEAEIRGHRRTYVGAMPGRIIQAMRQAGSKNPVILLDEVDKMAADFRGDPAASLLEVLDPEQNHAFGDHFLEVPFDLSQVMFVTTANVLMAIPRPLRDRMEVIELSGYTHEEKRHIAQDHLVPRQIEEHGLSAEQFSISENALVDLVEGYTRESGVRQLERSVASLCRKAAREILGGKERVHVTKRTLERYLGAPPYRRDEASKEDRVGVVHGMAYTETGGCVIQVEVSVAEGKGSLTLTGKLGDVMKESAQAGYSYVRSRATALGIDPNFHETKDIHIHVPEGAVPKEGPSAGITITLALVSALSGQPVRADVAMTGEITLRGRVLPVGGIKEKVLAAHRVGIETILLPRANMPDVEEIPASVRKRMHIRFVEHMDEVLGAAIDAFRDEPLFEAVNSQGGEYNDELSRSAFLGERGEAGGVSQSRSG